VVKSGKSAERRERLAAALRDNLKRRKARLRAMDGEGSQAPTEAVIRAPDLPAAGPNKAAKPG
jgi:hypothetical protein